MMRRTRASERGTVAIIVAISATMLFGLAALGVDLGAAYARKRDIQTQADLAALAAAAYLPRTASSQSDIEQAATDYALENEVAGQDTSLWDFSDPDPGNGYIEYVSDTKLRLFAAPSRVDFWLAPAAGLSDGANVSAVAAAEIVSPGKALPFFISTGCGWGQQTILDQTAGPPVPPGYEPNLTPTSNPPAAARIDSISPTSTPNDPTPLVTMTVTAVGANGMNNVNAIGFTQENSATAHYEVTAPVITGNTATVVVPTEVTSADDTIWWVRLRQGNQNRWSDSDNAKPFVVGNPTGLASPSCDSKNSGNFGSLELSRDAGTPSTFLVENMALGIQHALEQYPEPRPAPPEYCSGKPEAVTDPYPSPPNPSLALNCLETDTGSDLAQEATDAFITGTAQGSPPRLSGLDHPTRAGCDPDGGEDEREFPAIPGSPINDDVLSCFIKPGYDVGDVTKENGAPDDVISADIFDSPRFFWIPVLVADPSSGGAGSYAIVDFRAVFVTDQPDDATWDSPQADPQNGIEMSSNGMQIEKIKIRAINPRSLPPFSAGLGPDNTIPYLGSGTKIVRLVE